MRVLTTTLTQRLSNPALSGVSILDVQLSPDYAFARVTVDARGDEAEQTRAMLELEKASGALRSEIASTVKMRQTPQLRFQLDRGRENANRVEELLQQIKGE